LKEADVGELETVKGTLTGTELQTSGFPENYKLQIQKFTHKKEGGGG